MCSASVAGLSRCCVRGVGCEIGAQMAGREASDAVTIGGTSRREKGISICRKDTQQSCRSIATYPADEYIPVPENNSDLSFSSCNVLQRRSVIVEGHEIGTLSVESLIEEFAYSVACSKYIGCAINERHSVSSSFPRLADLPKVRVDETHESRPCLRQPIHSRHYSHSRMSGCTT